MKGLRRSVDLVQHCLRVQRVCWDLETPEWQKNLHTDVSKKVLHVVLILEGWFDLGLSQRVPKASEESWDNPCNYRKQSKAGRPIHNHMQNPQPAIFFATQGSPDPSSPSRLSNNAEPSLQISVDLSWLCSISIKSKLTPQDLKNIYLLFWLQLQRFLDLSKSNLTMVEKSCRLPLKKVSKILVESIS